MRRADWVDQMWRTIEMRNGEAFEYGASDCCLLVADVLDSIHGGDLRSQILADYHDEKTAHDLVARFHGLHGAITHYLGASAPAHHARRGDAVLVAVGDGVERCGICVGDGVVCAGDGVIVYPLNTVVCCWRVD